MGEKSVNIRKASIEDVEQICKIELASFTTPWSGDAFINELTQNKLAYYYVVELNSEIVGYAGMWIIFDEAHITNIAIHPKARGLKLGELLMKYMFTMAKFYGANSMTLEVRVSNHVARNLYTKLNFEEKGIRKNYYADTLEDALIMWVKI